MYCMRKCRLLADCVADQWLLEGFAQSAGWSWSVSCKEVACVPPEEHNQEEHKQPVHIQQADRTQAVHV